MKKELKGYIIEKYNNMTGAYTCHRLVEEAQKMNINLDIVGVHDCCLTPSGIRNSSLNLEKRDFVINRYKWGPIKDALNSLAEKSYNRIKDYDIFKNKFQQVKLLKSKEFAIPGYVLATSQFPYHTLEKFLKPPFVAKALENSMGREVMLIENEAGYQSLSNDFPPEKEWLFEEFIESSFRRDLRLFVIRGKAVACMIRKSKGDFRANVALGASVHPIKVSPVLQKIAEDIYRQTNLDVIGVDLLFGNENTPYYLCEINVMPGLEGIEQASGLNIAAMIIDLIYKDFQ